jgi:DNA (cytosine-5)-methyltransferase 1
LKETKNIVILYKNLYLKYFYMDKKRITVIDLFAGAGGLSEGFLRNHFEIVAYIEQDGYACDTLLTRHIYWNLRQKHKLDFYLDYLKGNIKKIDFHKMINYMNPVINTEISDSSLVGIIKVIKKRMITLGVKHIDVFIGGPPCQAYSVIGRARDPYKMEYDPRNDLYKYYIKLLNEFKPSVFVFENVPGLISAGKGRLWKDVQKYFINSGYNIDYKILDASNHMVLQRRKRIVLIGWKKEFNFSFPKFCSIQQNYPVRDLLFDLPPLRPGENIECGNYLKKAGDYLTKTHIRTNEDILIQHNARPLNENDREIYKMAINNWQKYKKRLKYFDLPSKLKTHNNEKSFIDRFKVVADDLPYSHTIVAHISKDGHYYIHPDINQIRSISVREAARLQSFPDNYKFEGPRTSQFKQIGNAVPPLLAEKLAKKIKEFFL